MDIPLFKNLHNAAIVNSQLLCAGLGKSPSYKLPEREMLVSALQEWAQRLHVAAHYPLRHLEVPTDNKLVCGIHFGAV
eukprot:6338324-Lingulodinium_polyedra.AAC.1